MTKRKISIMRCPYNHDYYAISIDEKGSGTRITPDKCCGSWNIIKQWNSDDIIIDYLCYALDLKRIKSNHNKKNKKDRK